MLQTGMIVGGWDKYEGGKIYGVPLGGTLLEQPFAIGGSGSSYLYGFFDQAWREGMSQEEAEIAAEDHDLYLSCLSALEIFPMIQVSFLILLQKLVVTAVSLAIARDGASGGVVRTVTINKDGVNRKFYPGDTLPLWHEEMDAVNSLLDIVPAASPEPMIS
ncbi:Proteasome subunit beta type-6 [Capsicum annuum]|nr:Proteasome subunit beta type-6 [Capsicum annuum]